MQTAADRRHRYSNRSTHNDARSTSAEAVVTATSEMFRTPVLASVDKPDIELRDQIGGVRSGIIGKWRTLSVSRSAPCVSTVAAIR